MKKNVMDYGVIGDGIADDTAALVTIFASLNNGDLVEFPVAHYLISSPLDVNVPCKIIGEHQKATIFKIAHNGDVFRINCGGVHISNLLMMSANSTEKTTGSYIHFTVAANQCILENFEMWHSYVGIRISSGATLYIDKGTIRDMSIAPGGCGILVDDGNDQYISRVTMDNADDKKSEAGIRITMTGCINVSDCDIIRCNYGLHFQGGSAAHFTDCYFDHCNQGVVIDASTWHVLRSHFTNCWMSSNVGGGITIIQNNWLVDAINFIGGQINFNNHNGIYLLGGNNIKILDNTISQNGMSGVALGNAKNVILGNNTIGATATMDGNLYGLYIMNSDFLSVLGNTILENINGDVVGSYPLHALIEYNF